MNVLERAPADHHMHCACHVHRAPIRLSCPTCGQAMQPTNGATRGGGSEAFLLVECGQGHKYELIAHLRSRQHHAGGR